jgi:hypothetical protein
MNACADVPDPPAGPSRVDKVRKAVEGKASPTETLRALGEAFNDIAKVAAGVAALGGVAYLVALLTVGLRLQDAGLPSHEVLSTVPRDQLLVGGTIELLATLVGAAVLVLLAVVARRNLRVQSLLLLALVLIVPVSVAGGLWVLVTGSLVALLRFWKTPNVAAVIVLFGVVAVALTLTRQTDFPSPFADAKLALTPVAGDEGVTPATVPPISGKYIGATSTDVLVGVKGEGRRAVEEILDGERVADSLVLIPRARIEQLVLSSSQREVEPPESLAARLGLEVTCLLPTCRLGDRTLHTPQ